MENKAKKIVVVTGSRSEYGILKPLLEAIRDSKILELELLVAGMHLLGKYGLTVNDIKKDGFEIAEKIYMYNEGGQNSVYFGNGLGRGIKQFTKTLSRLKPDVLLAFGDRLEPLAAVLAAALLKIPVGHIHGGDKTDSGHIDESTRHAITRYSNIHFAPTKAAARRLIKMGEEKFRVHNVGALSIDSILDAPAQKKDSLCADLGLDNTREIIVLLFSPLPLESELMGAQAKEICAAVRALKKQTVVIYPNNDRGSRAIITEIEKIRCLPSVVIFKNLPHQRYINLLRCADALAGNSSSGIIEAPALKLPVVNIGSRNIGREHAKNIIFVSPERKAIQRAVEKALYDKKLKDAVKNCKNPYGAGGTADAIVSVLEKLRLNKTLMLKRLTF